MVDLAAPGEPLGRKHGLFEDRPVGFTAAAENVDDASQVTRLPAFLQFFEIEQRIGRHLCH